MLVDERLKCEIDGFGVQMVAKRCICHVVAAGGGWRAAGGPEAIWFSKSWWPIDEKKSALHLYGKCCAIFRCQSRIYRGFEREIILYVFLGL